MGLSLSLFARPSALFPRVALAILRAEHWLNAWFVYSGRLPRCAQRLYGLARHQVGTALYRSRWCPSRSSPSRLISLALTDGCVYVDVGAHDGQMVGLASSAVGSRGRVYAFEPQANMHSWLARMQTAYALENLTLMPSLVGDSIGDVRFFESKDAPASSSLAEGWAGGDATIYPMTTLDEWSAATGVARVHLVKIDVEGAELRVIRGGTTFLRDHRPLLIAEIRDPVARKLHFGETVQDILNAIRDCGYTHYFLPRPHGLVEIVDAAQIQSTDNDLLAVSLSDPVSRHMFARIQRGY